MQLPSEIMKILERISAAGKEAYLVGGAVRDSIMGLTPTDFDITTSATPEEITEIFKDKRVIPTGIKHGTVTVIYNSLPTEITTYRTEKGYSDSRHPDEVCFSTDITEDLSRRDFTVNAICYHPKSGYLDPFNGVEDIKNRVIKTVGNPELRFREDALRIMRAIRFSAKLGFELEEATKNAVFELKDSLLAVSRERIMAELKKLLAGKNAPLVLNKYYAVLAAAMPLKKDITPDFSPLSGLYGSSLRLFFAAFFVAADMGAGSPELAELILSHLKSDNALKNTTLSLINCYLAPVAADKKSLRLLLTDFEPDIFREATNLQKAFLKIDLKKAEELLALLEDILKNKEAYRISHLNIKGGQLLAEGIEPPKISGVLNALLKAVIEGRCKNETDDLLKLAKSGR